MLSVVVGVQAKAKAKAKAGREKRGREKRPQVPNPTGREGKDHDNGKPPTTDT